MKLISSKKLVRIFSLRSFSWACAALFTTLFLGVAVLYLGYHEGPENNSLKALGKARSAINQELNNLAIKGDEIAANPELQEALARKDSAKLAELLSIEREKYNIGLMKVTDDQGVVLNRSKTKNAIGDNAFINTPMGRKMVETGKEISSVEVNSLDPRQVILSTGRFVFYKDKKVGSLFFSVGTTDDYAQYFARTYLPKGSEIIFYTSEHGLAGTSFTNSEDLKVLERYVRPEFYFLFDKKDTLFVRLSDWRIYIVRNLELPGVENNQTGFLVVTKVNYLLPVFIFSTFFPLLAFFVVLFIAHKYNRPKGKNSLFCCPIISGFVVFYCVSVITISLAIILNIPEFSDKEYPLYNSTLRFQPEGGTFDNRFAQRVAVVLDSGGEAINAIRLSLLYDPEALKVQSVDMDRSICKYFILSEHNSQTGKIVMECIIPSPGFSANNGIVADLFFKAESGTRNTSIRFLSDTKVLANDGLGTDVLRLAIDAGLRFTEEDSIDRQDSLLVFSTTHPNPERWYSKQNVSVAWAPNLLASIQDSVSLPSDNKAQRSPITRKIFNDGEYKFTIKASNVLGKEISGDLVVRIDTTPPEKLDLLASETKIKPGGLVRFTAVGSDSMSGLQKVFYLKINDEIFFPVNGEVYIPFPQAGTYNITLRAYDRAGNYKDVTKKIIVRRFQ